MTTNNDDDLDGFGETITVPKETFNSLLYAHGLRQWLGANADEEHVQIASRKAQHVYAAHLIESTQTPSTGEPVDNFAWNDNLRSFRAYIFENEFYVPELFYLTDFESPDAMFDHVEARLLVDGLIDSTPPERETDYVTDVDDLVLTEPNATQ